MDLDPAPQSPRVKLKCAICGRPGQLGRAEFRLSACRAGRDGGLRSDTGSSTAIGENALSIARVRVRNAAGDAPPMLHRAAYARDAELSSAQAL